MVTIPNLRSTPLLGAFANRKPEVVRLLLDNDADVHAHDRNGRITSEVTRCCPEQEEIEKLPSQNSAE